MFGPTVGKSKCSYVLSEMSYFYGLFGNRGTFGLQNRIILATGTEHFKTLKIGAVKGKQGRMLSLNVQIVYDVFVLRFWTVQLQAPKRV
jgi:hypothetical protein